MVEHVLMKSTNTTVHVYLDSLDHTVKQVSNCVHFFGKEFVQIEFLTQDCVLSDLVEHLNPVSLL